MAAGPHDVGVTFFRRNRAASDEPLQLHERHHDLQDMNGLPLVDCVSVTGPFNVDRPGRHAEPPADLHLSPLDKLRAGRATEEAACARTILTALARRAYRRPVTERDLDPMLEQLRRGRAEGHVRRRHRAGAAAGPGEPEVPVPRRDAAAAAGASAPVSDLELASRLSFFLWSSIPDEELLNLAAQGRLEPSRSCSSAGRADAAGSEVAGARRQLRGPVAACCGTSRVTSRSRATFPTSTTSCAQAFRMETELFFESIIREDRSVLDLLNADYTFVNERLARHYGIPNVYGSHFRRVTVQQDSAPRPPRTGQHPDGDVLPEPHLARAARQVDPREHPGHAAAGAAAGRPRPRREPARRGGPVAARAARGAPPNPTCASCHRVMDPLGFALENFDGLGQWREKEPGGAIDPTGQLADGTPSRRSRRTPQGAARAARDVRPHRHREADDVRPRPRHRLHRHAARAQDRARGAARDYRWSAIVLGIVRSAPFQMKKAPAPDGTLATADVRQWSRTARSRLEE